MIYDPFHRVMRGDLRVYQLRTGATYAKSGFGSRICGAEAGHLVVFDRTPDRPWAEMVFRPPPSGDGEPVTGRGM